jgi:excisionase family DNA binding protein
MPDPRPFSPETLADRWACSAEKVRRMYHDGEIAGFRLGKLIRIPAAEVDRIECQMTTASSGIGENMPSPGRTPNEDGFDARLARMTADSPKLALVKSGRRSTSPQANG